MERGDHLMVRSLISHIDTSLTFALCAQTERRMGFLETAERCQQKACRGYRSMLSTIPRLSPDPEEWEEVLSYAGALRRVLCDLAALPPDEPELPLIPVQLCSLEAPLPEPEPEAAPGNDAPHITSRETEVLRLVAEGLSTKQIAGHLGISFKTAACHRANLMTKLGAPNAASLVRSAYSLGLV